ncbi:hypothetical protein C8Q78DRAFT_991099 [Trametes maxima]|nr:hypothetical protein C8Q78DRAFT_991099 [Trametes maxima]
MPVRKISADQFEELYEKWLEVRSAPCSRRTFKCEQCHGHDCSWATVQAPDWWAERVREHELDNPIVHESESSKKGRSAGTRETRGRSNRRPERKRQGKKKASPPPSPSPSPEQASPSPSNPPMRNARSVLKGVLKSIMGALNDPTVGYEYDVDMAPDDSQDDSQDEEVASLALTDDDLGDLDEEAINTRLDTLRRQRARCLRGYAESASTAVEISQLLNECITTEKYNRHEAMSALQHAKECSARRRPRHRRGEDIQAEEETALSASVLEASAPLAGNHEGTNEGTHEGIDEGTGGEGTNEGTGGEGTIEGTGGERTNDGTGGEGTIEATGEEGTNEGTGGGINDGTKAG